MQEQTDSGLADLQDLTAEINRRPSRAKYKSEALSGFHEAEDILADRDDYQSVLEVMIDEQTLDPNPPPNFYARLGTVYEKRADQIENSLADATSPADKIRRGQQIIDMRNKAGDAFVVYSRAMVLSDDHGYADALWRRHRSLRQSRQPSISNLRFGIIRPRAPK